MHDQHSGYRRERRCKMVGNVFLIFLSLLFLFHTPVLGQADSRKRSDPFQLFVSFDDIPAGKLPQGWKTGATNARGGTSVWEVSEERYAPSGNHVLTMRRAARLSGSTFNLCWTDRIPFLNGSIEVRFKAVAGKVDQGGGIIWRVQNDSNYYIVRFNPLEENFRLYVVENGRRSMLATADIHLAPEKWHHIRIVHHDDEISCYLDGKPLLTKTDRRITKAGGVGLWTKADAVTSFDNFSLTMKKERP